MDAKVTVEEMAAAILGAVFYMGEHGIGTTTLSAARDYIIAAESQLAERDAALSKINDIRNSIIGTQTVNWSAHIYPLVAALEGVGIKGLGYDEARKNACTLIEQLAERDAQIAHLERKFPCGHRFYDWASPEESCVACAAKEFFDCADTRAEELYDEIRDRDAQIAEMRTHVQAIQREARFHERGGDIDLLRDLGTIEVMCEAILNPDFAAELGLTEANDAS